MIHTYIGEKAEHTHENEALEDFLERLEPVWGGSEEPITVIAQAMWGGAAIDLVCLLPKAIVVLDFKNYGGRIEVTENGPWRASNGFVKGGIKTNPFVQVRDNKYSVMRWLQAKALLDHCNLGHISGAVVFTMPAQIHSSLGHNITTWFHVTDLDHVVEKLAMLASPQINIDDTQAKSIVDALGVREYEPVRGRWRIRSVDLATADDIREFRPTERQQEALRFIEQFLRDPDSKLLSILGMTSTGKTSLLLETARKVEELGRQWVILAPNARIAKSLSELGGPTCASIYTHLFDRSNHRQVDSVDEASGQKLRKTVFPLRTCTDPDTCVYLIDEAHLLSNDYFELDDGKRFGSGHLFDDFLEHTAPDRSGRKVILFGDPYQLPRGRRESMPVFGELQRSRGIESETFTLVDMIETPLRNARLLNAHRLANAIAQGDFTSLELESGDGMTIIAKEEAASVVRRTVSERFQEAVYIADTNEKVSRFNGWIRRLQFGENGENSVVQGDLLEYVSGSSAQTDPFDSATLSPNPGDLVIVQKVSDNGQQQVQMLKGRDKPTSFVIRDAEIASGPSKGHIFILEDFLLAEKPELSGDLAIALEVWQAAHPTKPIGRLRYAYAATCHHAQGLVRPVCVVNADRNGGYHREEHFRWLYTAITRASEHCYVVNFQPLDLFDSTRWDESSANSSISIPVGFGWAPDCKDDYEQNIRAWLKPLGWEISTVEHKPYQKQFQLRSVDASEVTLLLSYSQAGAVKGLRIKPDESSSELLLALAESTTRRRFDDSRVEKIVHSLRRRAERKSLRIAAIRQDGEYRFTAVLVNATGERAQAEVNFNKAGMVTSVRLIQYTGEQIVEAMRNMLAVIEQEAQ